MQAALGELDTQHLGPGWHGDILSDDGAKDARDVARLLERFRMRHSIVETPEDLACSGRARRMLEIPDLCLKRLPDTFLTARGAPEANAPGMVPVIRSEFRQLLVWPEYNQHAQEFCCAGCLVQRLCIQPIRAGNPVEAAQHVILERRNRASACTFEHRLQFTAALRHAAIEIVELVVPCGMRLANQRNLVVRACPHDRKGPVPTPTTPSRHVILCKAGRAEYGVWVRQELGGDQLAAEIIGPFAQADRSIAAQVMQ